MNTKEKKNKLPKETEMKQYILWFVCKNSWRKDSIETFDDILIFDFIYAMGWGITPGGSCYKEGLDGNIEIIGRFENIYYDYADDNYKISKYFVELLFKTIKALEGVYYDNE